eukprot:m51a1_g13088 hypothetical protein (569) ;mRNA; r:499-2716
MFHCPTKYECQNCHRTFASPQALGGHRAHPCQPEGSRRGSRSRCDSESSGDEDDYVCCDCGRAFASPQALGGHRAHPCQPEGSRRGRRSCCVSDSSSSSSSSECEYEYECCDCGRAFETQQGLNGHKAHCRPQQARATPSRRPAGDCTAGAFECPCGRTFESQRGLSGHRAHCKAQARPQTQPRCTGDAAGRRSGGAFECPCGRTFESQQGLSGHRAHCRAQARPQLQLQPQRPGPVHYAFDSARVYSSGGAFKCPCGRSFESQQGLSGHRAHCTAEYPKDAPDGYECPACDRVFATEEEFWTHWVHCGGAPDTKSRSKASGARFVSDVAETSSSVIAVLVRSSFKPKGSCVDESKALLSFFMDKVPDLDAAHIIRGCRGTAECIKRRKEARALIEKQGLSTDEVLSIALYTYDTSSSMKNSNFYFQLNKLLRSGKEEEVREAEGYLYYFLGALAKLPDFNGVVYRGNPNMEDVKSEYVDGRKIIWRGFTSTTTDANTARSFAMGRGVVFRIRVLKGKSIEDLSAIKSESEVLLRPNTELVVASPLVPDKDGINYIDLQQVAGKTLLS